MASAPVHLHHHELSPARGAASGADPGGGLSRPAQRVGELLERLRAGRPLVQCLTNAVVTGFSANALLALGASPAMTDIQGEAGAFARIADGVLVNLGTPTPEQRRAMREAVAARTEMGAAWVLDPVAVGSLPIRTALARELLAHGPAVVRANASEVIALGGGEGGRGTDSSEAPEAAAAAAAGLLRGAAPRRAAAPPEGEAALGGPSQTVPVGAVAVSGACDLVLGPQTAWRVPHGHELLTRVTGGGCALGAVIAAFTAVSEDPVEAAVAGSAVWGLAAEDAAQRSGGPGTFAVQLLDALASLSPEQAAERVRISPADAAPTDAAGERA